MSNKNNSAFYYPKKKSNESSESPDDLVNSEINKQESKNNAIIDLTQGKTNVLSFLETFLSKKNINTYYMNTHSNGRTLNVPKELPAGILPTSSYNGGITVGEKCIGPHCSISVPPTTGYLVGSNLKSANPPPGALQQYPSTFRLGNNSDVNPRIKKYQGTQLNSGPFNIEVQGTNEEYKYIMNPETGVKVKYNSKEGQKILENYKNYNN